MHSNHTNAKLKRTNILSLLLSLCSFNCWILALYTQLCCVMRKKE